LAQAEGLEDFPVFTRKAATDVSYLANARRLLTMTDRIYPQFATHNAHTVAAILEMARGMSPEHFEFQRLHGMGDALHDLVQAQEGTRCRIYAPVGAHRDLLAYLVRRLLENGANSSFVNQIVDESVPPQEVAACPFETLSEAPGPFEPKVVLGPDLFAPERRNAQGFDLHDVTTLRAIDAARILPQDLEVAPVLAGQAEPGEREVISNPATGAPIGTVAQSSGRDVETALAAARPWAADPAERAQVLNRAADLYEAQFGEIFGVLAAEAGKTLPDAVAELREAVDFLRYYAAGASALRGGARGVFTCISPWNFPLAIFTGQVSAALAAGNAVLAKPAETTTATAALGVRLLHEAGVPKTALQFLPGQGSTIGAALTADPRVNGVAFTGSTATARRIQAAMAEACAPGAPLIAETGGLNAMIVDSTALPEQAVRDIVASAFQSAGQRCSALRCLYVQRDIATTIREMLTGAMDALSLGDPWNLETDIGPVITADAAQAIERHIAEAADDGRLVHRIAAPRDGTFVAPALIEVGGIGDLQEEIFGPVLHMATFDADDLGAAIEAVNATGYGLTFGLHTRIDDRVQMAAETVQAGNIYANRNQIGAIVGSQPFGGEGLSGTGPKAGGPHYLERFTRLAAPQTDRAPAQMMNADTLAKDLARARDRKAESASLPGPTGELNRLSTCAREPLLCLGPRAQDVAAQVAAVEALGGHALAAGAIDPDLLAGLQGFGGVLWWGEDARGRAYARALAGREGAIIPLISSLPDRAHVLLERHLCVDTTAAGGNAKLLSGG
ncbi:MAG: bifunctional proline dehydrogenase/L-glutamate gamma-semialdehyde dehydrogenase PutA, partial [Pseudomonadota bacterium]